MAHFAELDSNNIVLRVIVVSNDDIKDSDGNESEALGIAFCKNLIGSDTNWVQTSYNSNMRGVYAGVGYTYDSEFNIFISPQPHENWTYNRSTKKWEAPVAYPNDGKLYTWDRDNQRWNEVS